MTGSEGLDDHDFADDPVAQFRRWYAGIDDDAAALATATSDGRVSARMVLLRGVDEMGFRFFTNLDSAKARELRDNPWAALVFHWHPRQVRVEGPVEQVAREEAEAYWRDRPRPSQLGAWASHQSRVIESRGALELELARTSERFADEQVPLPPFWGGYRIVPERVEFWLHREDRLHDRLRYRRRVDAWILERLAP